MKKIALGLTLLCTVAVSAACQPAVMDQGAVDDQRLRGAGQYQGRTDLTDRSTIGGYDIGRHQSDYRDRTFGANNLERTRGNGLGTGRGMQDGLGTSYNFGQDTRRAINGAGLGQGGMLHGGMAPRQFASDDPNFLNRGNNRLGGQEHMFARTLEQDVEKIPGVRDARVEVQGNNVICGVDADGNQEEVMNRVRQMVEQRADGAQVHVTDNLNNFGQGLLEGIRGNNR